MAADKKDSNIDIDGLYAPERPQSVAELDLADQPDEIEHRLAALKQERAKTHLAILPIHIQVALGISRRTLDLWRQGKLAVRDKDCWELQHKDYAIHAIKDDKTRDLIRRRAMVINAYLDIGEALTVDVVSDRNSRGAATAAVKLLEARFGYKTAATEVQAPGGWEALMRGARVMQQHGMLGDSGGGGYSCPAGESPLRSDNN